MLVGAGIADCALVASGRAFDPIPVGTEGRVAALEADKLELGEGEPVVLEAALDAMLVRPPILRPKCPLSP